MSDKRPELDFDPTLGHLCPDWTPLKITGAIREWLTQHFSTPANIVFKDLVNNVWKENNQTGILIEANFRWKPDSTEKRPACIIKRHELTVMNPGLGASRFMGNIQAQEAYSNLLVGSHSVYCIAGTGAAAEVLAAETYQELLKFAPVIRRRWDIMRVSVAGIGELSKLEESQENFVVPITMVYGFWHSWTIVDSPDADGNPTTLGGADVTVNDLTGD